MSVFVFAVEDQEAEEDATQEAKSSEERCWTLASGAPWRLPLSRSRIGAQAPPQKAQGPIHIHIFYYVCLSYLLRQTSASPANRV